MAKYVKVSSLGRRVSDAFGETDYLKLIERMKLLWKREIEKVLPDKPDLIVLPECCDEFSGLSSKENIEYYRVRKDQIRDYFMEIAKENNCYIAYSAMREYWTNCGRPREWLFPSNDPEKHIIPRTVQKIMKTACQTAGITKKATPHTLRHCFSTHMLEAGVSIFIIKVLLGHSSISSTCRYLHMVRPDAFNIKSPLDVLDGDVNA
jgi:hypothetical protein